MADLTSERWRPEGATLSPDGVRPLHFGDAAAELEAALERCVLAERSDLTRVLARGPDFLGLLHRLSTGAVASLGVGEGRPTVLTTAKGRIVERLFASHLGEAGVLCVGGAGTEARVLEHLARYTFAERTGLEPATAPMFQFVLVGPRGTAAIGSLGLEPAPRFGARPAAIGGCAVHLLGHDGLSGDGHSIVGRAPDAARVWAAAAAAARTQGGRLAGHEALEARRLLRGLPASGRELTEEHNPLEAGLWEAVSFDKGCYVGQEVVARLRTYDKISRSLVGLELPRGPLPAPGTPLRVEGAAIGQVTSAVIPPGREVPIGLGYVKRRVLRPGLEVRVGDAGDLARVVDLPFTGGAGPVR
jgi:folate-binding protein YgfZ